MQIRTKKKNADGIVRLETSGKIKEVLMNEDFLKPKEAKVSICFKGKNSSGIVDLDLHELEILFKEVMPKVDSLRSVKVMKFDK